MRHEALIGWREVLECDVEGAERFGDDDDDEMVSKV
jgi:hypothetical protein